MARAQLTIEFMFAIAVIMLIFIILLGFVHDKKVDLREKESYVNKRAECLRISDLLSSVFAAGPGAKANFNTNYLITILNNSLMMVEEISNISLQENKIAVLASEAGETTLGFFNQMTTELNPNWYRTCFSDITWSCPGWISDNIAWDLQDLMENISDYNTIYLEDSHIRFDAQIGGQLYTDILSDWVSQGNALILAEHTMCREDSSSYPSTSYRCNPPGSNGDVWDIFGESLHQRGGSYGNDITVVKEENGFNLEIGEKYDFEEDSYVSETANTTVIARYDDNSQPAILYWEHGNGRIYYFADFQVEIQQSQYTSVLVNIIKSAYSLITPVEESEILCSFYAKSPYYQLTGDLAIENIDYEVILTNGTMS